ncbi:MAG: hypothetical protein LBC20_15515 [Planctomycetaceae bacterium]|jgi:hypothetical protein|nr:hypothetical protein [Planctomycetaceae bacterium]
MKIFQQMTLGLSLASQAVLWLAGIFAVIGLLWREPPNINTGYNSIAVLALTVWVGFLMFLSRLPQQPQNTIKYNIFWIPVLLIGFLLPFPLLILYVSLLGITELFRWLPAGRIYKNNTLPVITPVENDSEQEDYFDDSITQKIVRRFSEIGKDRLEGTFLVGFQNEQLTVTVHIPFCPIFESEPNVEVFLLDDVDVKWNIFRPRTFGVRIDLKRNSCKIQQVRILVVAE